MELLQLSDPLLGVEIHEPAIKPINHLGCLYAKAGAEKLRTMSLKERKEQWAFDAIRSQEIMANWN